MFTGIVEATGRVRRVAADERGCALEIDTDLGLELVAGASLAINGTCLTILTDRVSPIRVEVVAETLRRTNLSELVEGSLVNLERPLRVDGRLDGHIVQGHVDAVGVVRSTASEGIGTRLAVNVEESHQRYLVEKGSIAVDGISLTVASVDSTGFEVAVIPHTLRTTNLGLRTAGDKVNLEFDVLAKYVERLLRP